MLFQLSLDEERVEVVDVLTGVVRRDPRSSHLLLASSPVPVLCVSLCYVLVCVVGRRCAPGRALLSLPTPLLPLYNLTLLTINAYIAKETFDGMASLGYSILCQPHTVTYSPGALKLCRATHLYFLSKLLELFDSVYFLVRGRVSHVSVLHVYHHACMIMCSWCVVYGGPTGSMNMCVLINSTVHVFMYAYYTLSTFTSLKPYLTWKRYLTALQMLQFVFLLTHCVYNLATGCPYPRPLLINLTLFDLTLLLLFTNFYVNTYWRTTTTRKKSLGEVV